ncbi:MAG TPA: hypothetical protein DDW52_23655 [Planctomycetaceae bacterium]|nr:hypothetical protein [Planctomycetaceae bacterium]
MRNLTAKDRLTHRIRSSVPPLTALLLCFTHTLCLSANESVKISVTVQGDGTPGLGDRQIGVIRIPLRETPDGKTIALTKPEIFAATQQPTLIRPLGSSFKVALQSGKQVLFAFCDSNRNGRWDPAVPEAIGWYTASPSGRPSAIDSRTRPANKLTIKLSAPHPMPTSARFGASSLKKLKGYTVVHLKGDAEARGLAHGRLLAPQIIDFFRFYILEDKFGGAQIYENGFAKFLHSNFRYPTGYQTECKAVIRGMNESGCEMYIPELGRDFRLTDLYAISGYIETRAMRSSCTQFAAWGDRTLDTDVAGGMITGRNMDGEIDLRKVTVSHFVLFAVEPTEPNQKKYISMMWPGFVATISGLNEDGFYAMENAGLTGPGKTVQDMVHFSWTMREALATFGPDTKPKQMQELVDSFDNSAGGSCGPGCITLFATPYTGQSSPAYILEGDRFGDAMRTDSEVFPYVPQALVASNHHRKYGVATRDSSLVFGKSISFSSRWRYEAGSHKLDSWYRFGKTIGTEQMRELLQTVAHGTTEYSIITRPNAREFDVAIASMKAEPWDAPYRKWTSFQFSELFP